MQRAQPAGRILDVRFEVVRGVVETGVSAKLISALRREIFDGRPNVFVGDESAQERIDLRVTRDASGIEKRCINCRIARGEVAAFIDGARSVSGLESDIPQAGEKRFERVSDDGRQRLAAQRDEIDIEMREQFSAPESADGIQRETRAL